MNEIIGEVVIPTTKHGSDNLLKLHRIIPILFVLHDVLSGEEGVGGHPSAWDKRPGWDFRCPSDNPHLTSQKPVSLPFSARESPQKYTLWAMKHNGKGVSVRQARGRQDMMLRPPTWAVTAQLLVPHREIEPFSQVPHMDSGRTQGLKAS